MPLLTKALFSQMSCNSSFPTLKKIRLRKTFGYTGTAFYVGYGGRGGGGGGGGGGWVVKKNATNENLFQDCSRC